MRGEQLAERCVPLSGARHNVPSLCIFTARQRTNSASGLLNQEWSGRCIPRGQPKPPECTGAAPCDISQVGPSRTRTTHTSGVLHSCAEHLEIRVEILR